MNWWVGKYCMHGYSKNKTSWPLWAEHGASSEVPNFHLRSVFFVMQSNITYNLIKVNKLNMFNSIFHYYRLVIWHMLIYYAPPTSASLFWSYYCLMAAGVSSNCIISSLFWTKVGNSLQCVSVTGLQQVQEFFFFLLVYSHQIASRPHKSVCRAFTNYCFFSTAIWIL